MKDLQEKSVRNTSMSSISAILLFRIKLCSSFCDSCFGAVGRSDGFSIMVSPNRTPGLWWTSLVFSKLFSFLHLIQCRLQNLLDFDVSSIKYANTCLSELSPSAPLFLNKMVRTTDQISQEMGTHSDGSCSLIRLVLDKSKPQPLGQIPQDSG